MVSIEVPEDLSGLDESLEAVPNQPAVFLLWPREGEPYLARTALLRRRLLRLLRARERPSRLLNLRHTVRRIEYWLTGSRLESAVCMYELARRHFPSRYPELLKLRLPPYLKLVLSNDFPRTQVTTHLGRSPALYYGPFRSRAAAERFESEFLNLFQIRRCQEDLLPSPEHPGCIYGEMGMCLRPCQQVVGPDEYRHEVERVAGFLRTDGRSLLGTIGASRDRLSQEMLFEEADRQHKHYQKVQEILKGRDDLARSLERWTGLAVTASTDPDAVELWPILQGRWHGRVRFSLAIQEGKTISLDRRLREVLGGIQVPKQTNRQRTEYLALLARWYYSSWRDGEWLDFDDLEHLPYRKLVLAVARAVRGAQGSAEKSHRN